MSARVKGSGGLLGTVTAEDRGWVTIRWDDGVIAEHYRPWHWLDRVSEATGKPADPRAMQRRIAAELERSRMALESDGTLDAHGYARCARCDDAWPAGDMASDGCCPPCEDVVCSEARKGTTAGRGA